MIENTVETAADLHAHGNAANPCDLRRLLQAAASLQKPNDGTTPS